MGKSIKAQPMCEQEFTMNDIIAYKNKAAADSCEVAVIGGGRWSKIITGILAKSQYNVKKIHLISSSNFKNTVDWVKGTDFYDKVSVSNDLNSIEKNKAIKAAFVINFPAYHYSTVKFLLEADKHVMVEKPFVFEAAQAKELVDLAQRKNLVLAVGLEFMMSDYLHRFKDTLSPCKDAIENVTFIWHDVFRSNRHGIYKLPDMTVNVFMDIFPHVQTVLSVLFNDQKMVFDEIDIKDGGDSCQLRGLFGQLPVHISLSRTHPLASRRIEIATKDKNKYSLDFTKEPGKARVNGNDLPEDPHWQMAPGVLDLEVDSFFYEIQVKKREIPFMAEKTLTMTEALEGGNRIIRNKQTSLIGDILGDHFSSITPKDVIIALREHILLPLLEEDLISNPKDEERIYFWVEKAYSLIHRLANYPLTSQKELVKELDISKEDTIKLNAALRKSSFCQSLILEYGSGVKYWKNTILPLVQSGNVDAVVNNKYQYPHRIGVYLGRLCMFSCSFCGRHPNASYKRTDVSSGNEMLKNLMKNAPKDDPYRFYISGGLEPLSNDGIGDIVTYGSELGFKMSVYTNGFLLTPGLLDKQKGLWDLDVLRISIYGVDDESTYNVTKNKKAFNRVLSNVKEFLVLRDKNKSKVKLGFNFVILPGCAHQILELAELIAEINKESGAEQQIDFLTLREDYSYGDEKFETSEELSSVFNKLKSRQKSSDLKDLYIDYGYALYGPSIGKSGVQLYSVTHNNMLPKGYPQISIVVDLLGDVYLYREAGFLDRPGAERYIIGRVSDDNSLEDVIREFINSGAAIPAQPEDTNYYDAFDHLVTGLLNQMHNDKDYGVPFDKGPVIDRIYTKGNDNKFTLAHPTLVHPSLPENTNKEEVDVNAK